jgi:hypothetical protein
VTKLSSEGELTWTRQWGSDTGRDEATGVRVDGSEIAVVGTLSGMSLDARAFATRFSTDGDMLWTTEWDEPDAPTANAVAIGSSGHAHVVGRGGSSYIVLIELDSGGDMVKASRWDVSSAVEPRGIDLSPDGALAIIGHTWGALTSAPNAGAQDAFLLWVDPR